MRAVLKSKVSAPSPGSEGFEAFEPLFDLSGFDLFFHGACRSLVGVVSDNLGKKGTGISPES
jgi:hypothetical protein